MKTDFIGKKVIVRSYGAGVFFGTLADKDGQEVVLTDARRLWYWSGANSISDIAIKGVANPNGCKFTASVSEICVLQVIEIIPCTDAAIDNINNVRAWTR